MTPHVQEFIKKLDKIRPSKSRYEIFSDWLILASASLYATWKKDKAVEEEYLQVAKLYTKEELEQLSGLLGMVTDALEEKEQDFLGEVFTYGEMSNSRTGQFFTPYHISYMMAEMSIGDAPKNQILKICDPACGSGVMLIASADVLRKRGMNYQWDVYFKGIDIDPRCARMTFIQMSLLGAPAVIVCGNALTNETFWEWETIGYCISGMDFRLKTERMFDRITQPQTEPQEEKEVEKVISLPPARELVQGELF